MVRPRRAPVAPNLRPDPIKKPEELEEYLQIVVETFESSQVAYLYDLVNFTSMPGEGLLDLATRFDNLAIPLLNAHLTTERDLALVLRKHIPIFLRKKTFAKMETQDDKRRIRGEEPSIRQEMIAIAREVEMNIIAHEVEMRKCGEIPPPRSTDPCSYNAHAHANVAVEVGVDARPKRPMADRLGDRIQLKDRLGSRVMDTSTPENRKCHRCQQEGQIARNCPNPREADQGPPTPTKVSPLAGHRTKDVICSGYQKEGHTFAQCWKEHPEQIPKSIQKRRMNGMSAQARKKLRSHISVDHKYQTMALSYH